jgi:hypothetical protein
MLGPPFPRPRFGAIRAVADLVTAPSSSQR